MNYTFGTVSASLYDPAAQKVVPKDAVVLDLSGPTFDVKNLGSGVVKRLHRLAETGNTDGASCTRQIVRAIADQIERQVKPPRIPEPGWGEQVVASTQTDEARRKFVRPGNVWCDETGRQYVWNTLVDPVLVRDGIE